MKLIDLLVSQLFDEVENIILAQDLLTKRVDNMEKQQKEEE